MLSNELELTESVYNAINNLLEEERLIEQVGILFGTIIEKKIMIDNFVEMENLDRSPKSFSIDYGILIEHINTFQKEEKDLCGFFHSHPGGKQLFPSKKDVSFMKLWPSPYIWFIGIYPNKFAAFTLLKDQIKEIPYKITLKE